LLLNPQQTGEVASDPILLESVPDEEPLPSQMEPSLPQSNTSCEFNKQESTRQLSCLPATPSPIPGFASESEQQILSQPQELLLSRPLSPDGVSDRQESEGLSPNPFPIPSSLPTHVFSQEVVPQLEQLTQPQLIAHESEPTAKRIHNNIIVDEEEEPGT
jgi:hypothetical protein